MAPRAPMTFLNRRHCRFQFMGGGRIAERNGQRVEFDLTRCLLICLRLECANGSLGPGEAFSELRCRRIESHLKRQWMRENPACSDSCPRVRLSAVWPERMLIDAIVPVRSRPKEIIQNTEADPYSSLARSQLDAPDQLPGATKREKLEVPDLPFE